MIALEHCINTEKEKITKKIKTEKEQKKQKISSAKEQKAIKRIINLGSPCDSTLLTNLTIAPKHISTIFSPEADGNCGYRAIAMEVYQDQEEWSKVKDKMLETFLKHQNNYYHGRMEHGNMPASNNPLIRSLQDKRSPLPQQHWFGTINHPQLVADTFSRAVAVYWNTPIETGDCLFIPFATLPEKVEPIIIILDTTTAVAAHNSAVISIALSVSKALRSPSVQQVAASARIEVCNSLKILGVDTGHILDINFPAKNVVLEK
ncbi:hypothetical protein PHYBLDRAFT_143948 [Phycomyces blakesleeanus NRRL 1555(-)]|uniref:OTU domain-containing protein n=1 Tax=Phycomyces blakesleeanus (strain ATCC 8743b / DSM 1359 / FGSC 10004 / NBRC 33097 / NRRL 1555) TaxID=763407 RepID=A0A162PSZ8_PHYB8|nr:hypothetical protein PHYBLDRAFT_143948 [Phycomyces blakesleeanus NRRL 1555(-)]OAD75697.1 hypothetical protein PHYBLDRAFT_143948 [Phycomyces blakesleeanus NRRL 1555(-)]|eukprot:XP_018293737.1 hypothetical protein PHYBLDRAFT_143948 [Phycomyces blakesleeanus NRRL 1555(-)]